MFSNGKELNTTGDEDLSNIPSYHSSVSSMPPINISIEGIETLLSKLDTNKSAGPDQIPSYILRTLCSWSCFNSSSHL